MDNLEGLDRFLESSIYKTEPGRNRNYEQANYKHWNWSCDKKTPPNKTKAQDQMASQNSIKHLEKT